MKKYSTKIWVEIIIFILIINILSIVYASYNIIKTYIIDNGYLYKENDGITVEEYKEKNGNPSMQIYSKSGEILGDEDKVSTGDIAEENGVEDTIVLRGDLNGDGNMDENDFLAIKEHIIEKNILQNEYEEAADLDENEDINLTDVLLFKRIRSREDIPVEGISLDKENCNIIVGEETTLTATVFPENATNKNVTWNSSNTDIAVVDANGKVTAIKAGTTIITATTNDGNYTAQCEIHVLERSLEKIEIIKEPSKKTYIQNYEELDVTGGKIRLTYNDTTTEEIDITSDMVSGFDNTELGPQTLTVTYEGKMATYEVTIVAKELEKIEIVTEPSKETYIQNYEELDVTGGKIRLTYSDTTTEEMDITSDMVSGFDNTTLGPQTLTVTYAGKTATYEVTIIAKALEKIEIVTEPSKKTYIQNYEELDITGGKIRLTYNDTTTEEIDITEEMVTGFDNTELGPQTLTVTYEGKIATYEVTIIAKAIEKIEIVTEPSKETYIQNYEELDVTGGKIRLTYSDTTTEEMDITSDMVSGFDNTTLGPRTLTVTYAGKSTTYEVTIIAKALEKIEVVTEPSKKTYIQNYEKLDVTGGKIRLTYSDTTTEEIDITSDMVSGFDNTELGPQTLTVTYAGKLTTYEVTIIAKALERIEIVTEPSKKTYIQNYENLDVTGGKIRLTYNDTTTEEIDITEEMVTGFDNTELGPQTLTVTYEGKIATYEVTIIAKALEKIEVVTEPSKKTYIQNYEELDITGGKIRLTYSDTTTEEIDITEEMVTGFDNTTLGPQTLTVTYEGKTATFEVTIIEERTAKLDKSNIELNAGEETTLTITTTPDNVQKSYTSKVENSSVVKIEKTDTFGVLKLTGLARGTTKITFVVTVDGTEITLECNVTVNAPDIPVTGITLNKTEITLEKGQTETITATITPENATNKKFNWGSDNAEVIKLVSSENGVLTIEALSEGEATITATTEDGEHTAKCKVTVKGSETEEPGIKLDKTSEIIASAETLDITALKTGTEQNINWETSNSVIATVSATTGNTIKVTGKKAGKATITATTEDGNYTATCEINVVYPITGVTINEETESVQVGSETLLTAVLNPINATNQNVTWSSSNEEIATVNEYGKVTGIKEGNVEITVTTEDGKQQATCPVEVTAKKAETSASEFTYTTQNNKIIITGYTGSNTEVVIPEKIDGMPVETIGNSAKVSGFDNVTSVVLPDTVKRIEGTAFRGYTKLTNIDLKNIETIGYSAFKECTGLQKITLPDTLTRIEDSAFYGCTGLNCNLIIPDSVDTMERLCFNNCKKLIKIKLSVNCSKIPYGAFNSTGLTGPLEIPEGVEVLDGQCFQGTNFTSVKFADSVKYIYQNAFRSCSSKMEGELILPKNLIHWGDAQFDHANFTNTSIKIPKSLEIIGGDANPYFYETYRTENTGYGTHSFYNLAPTTLKEFIVEDGNTKFKAVDGVLFTADGKRLVSFPCAKIVENGTYQIPEGVEQIDELGFSRAGSSAGNLTKIILPSTFTIKEHGPDNLNCSEKYADSASFNTLSSAFYVYNGIKEIEVNENNPNYKSIDGCVYSKDGSILWYVPVKKTGDLTIPEGTTTIAHGAFYPEGSVSYCSIGITSLHIPASLKDFSGYVLKWINKLPSSCTITVDENNPYWTVDSNGDIVARSLESIEILNMPKKTNYIQNRENLDVTGGKIKLIYNDGSTGEKDITTEMITGFDNTELGPKTLTVTYEGKTATFEVTIIEERTAKLDKTNIELNAGEETILTIITTPDNVEKSYTSKVENSSVVKIEKTGTFGVLKLTGLEKGTTKITFVVTVDETEITLECNVTVKGSEAEEPEIKLDKTSETMASAETLDITALKTGTEQNINWETSNSVIATVSATTGNTIKVTGKKAGKATITATTEDGNYTATCEINVVYPIIGVTINEETESVQVGSETLLTAVLNPINATNQNVTWSSSNEEIATVDEYGIVEGLKEGNVTITATTEDGNKQATCEVTVTNKKSETPASEFTYTTQYGVTSITGYTGSATEVVIPETINGRTVEEIGNGYSQVTGFDNVTSIVLPDTVKIINRQSFKGYSNLTNIDLKNVEQIDVAAFEESGLTKVTLPETLKIIGDYAFNKCTNLEGNIIIPNSVTTMGKYCFAECTKISTVKFSENCVTIPERAFYKSSLTGPLVFPEGVVTIDAYSFYGTECTSVKFADTIKYIYQNAFRQCSSKMEGELILPKNLEHWGDALFDHARNCTNTTIVIPKTLKYIGGDASPTTYPDTYRKENTGYGTHTFYDIATYSLKEFVVEEGNENYQAVDGVLFSKDMKRLVAFPSAKTVENGLYEIPEGVEQIDELSFSLAGYAGFPGNLKTLKLPSTFKISEYGPDNIMCKEPSKSQVCYNTLSVGLYIYNGINEIIVSEDNPDFKSVDGCVYSKDGSTLWYVPIQKTGTLNIPEGTTKIARGSFAEGYSTCPLAITGLNIPASLVEIEEDTLPWINKLPSRCTITVDENNPYWTVDSNGDIVEK